MSDEDRDTLYCICRQPYNENEFMIECEVCSDWFHGSCVGILEHQAPDIEIYHCPNCQISHGPLKLKQRRNWHRHDYSDNGSTKAVQTGTVIFIKELKGRAFPSADEIPITRLRGHQLCKEFFQKNGFEVPILIDSKDGLDLTVPPPNFTVRDVEDHVGSMREIDVIDVARQEDHKMLMREWTEYYNSPNRDKIFNVISLEFSKTKLSDRVEVPLCVRDVSWACNGVWPDQLPEDCTYRKPEVQKYCLMGVKDSFTDFHVDFGGTSVWYHVLRGEKVFYLIRPTNANLGLYETWLNASNQSELFFGDQVDKCYKCVVRQGQTVLLPSGWIHAVFTPIDSLVFGGNFLHDYSIPMQLEVYAIEKRVKTAEKYLFPSYETMNWYAAKHVLDTMRDYLEEGKKPPDYIFEGAKALVYHLRSWSQRKDFAKSAKHDVPEHIQYGRLLKDLGKEVKTCEETMGSKISQKATSKSTSQMDRKRRKQKKKDSTKGIDGLDILDQHTHNKLVEMEEERKSIYNFDEEQSDVSSPGSRVPKIGAYTESSEGESPEKFTANRSLLTLKVSNGKIVSERKAKQGEFQPLVTSEDSDSEGLVVDENPSKRRPSRDFNNPKLKLKLSFHHPQGSSDVKTEQKPSLLGPQKPSLLGPQKSPPLKKPSALEGPSSPRSLTSPRQPLTPTPRHPPSKQTYTVPPISTLLPPKTEVSQLTDLDLKSRPVKQESKPSSLVKSDLTLSDIIKNQSALNSSLSTIGKVEPLTPGNLESSDEQEARRNIPTIRGGLNGSIADILEASGYGTETAFTVDDDPERASSPSMREAIQGMLSMSRGGLSGMQLFSRAESRRQAIRSRGVGHLAEEDEEEQLSKCYQDDEYVYPTLEMDDDDQDHAMKSHSKHSKDQTWNPKARVHITVPLGERTHREGVAKESVKNSLEASAAKIADQPKVKRQYKKKTKLDMDAGPSSSFLSPTQSGSAFRPGIKSPTHGGDNPLKRKKPKKGEATAKQRLGKILKMHKMMH
ncbi:lysine-specific demethylase 7B-like isoform X2 [Dreissena polymorpha]|uniref:lysine-specific demethylase 7B-like isoform X2 n=1 Tax=Dreissena polymorpha TaxID=45954 RepID=UPI002264867F|nr:lysine-specific demethylase 7B-like isoform X2 [Dreissena polymorpha]